MDAVERLGWGDEVVRGTSETSEWFHMCKEGRISREIEVELECVYIDMDAAEA